MTLEQAEHLSSLISDVQTKAIAAVSDHSKYGHWIDSVTVLHQYIESITIKV